MPGRREPELTTSAVAETLGVSPSTIRRWLRDGVLPEPEWGGVGLQRQRVYNSEWLREAMRLLDPENSEPRLPGEAVTKLAVVADLGPCTVDRLALLLSRIADLYAVCYHASTWPRRNLTAELSDGRLWVASVTLASPLHIVGAAKAGGEAARAAKATADMLESIATIGAKRKRAKADAEVSEGTIKARIALENAQARKAVAEAEQAELLTLQRKVELLGELAALGEQINDPHVRDGVRHEARRLLGTSATDAAITDASRIAVAIGSDVREIEASAGEV